MEKNTDDILLDLSILYLEDPYCITDDFPTKPIARDNPYYMCSSCHTSVPEISNFGHSPNCSWKTNRRRFVFVSEYYRNNVNISETKLIEKIKELTLT